MRLSTNREQGPDLESRARVLDFELAHLARADRKIMMRKRERLDESERSGGHGAVRRARATVVAQRAALDAERELRVAAEAERDRLREAYEALKIQVELAHRRLVIAKAERVRASTKKDCLRSKDMARD